MRIGRAVAGTFLGTLAVGAVGLVIAGPVGSLLSGLMGFGAAAVYLRDESPRKGPADRRAGRPHPAPRVIA